METPDSLSSSALSSHSKLAPWSEWIRWGNPYTQKTWSHSFLATGLAVWFVPWKAWANLVKWSVTTRTSTECCLWSSALQKSMHTNSIGADVLMLSRGARADGSGVLARLHLWQHLTYSFTSDSIFGQKNHCLARCRVLACPWCPARSCMPCKAFSLRLFFFCSP